MTIMQRRKHPSDRKPRVEKRVEPVKSRRRKVEHVYTLRFDNAPDQTVKAIGPTEAVALRQGERMPYQITDETLVNLWLTAGRERRTAERSAAAILTKPVYADPDDAPVYRFSRAKDMGRA